MKKYCVYIVLSFLAVSCGSPYEVPENIKLFRYNEAAGIRSLDPAFARDQANIWGVNQLFNGLVQLDDSLKIQPSLAKSWEIANDGLTYTFHLRSDVFFHENTLFGSQQRRLVAADVQYSLQRLVDPAVASPGRWVMNQVALRPDSMLNITAHNDSTVSIVLKNPFAPFLSLLANPYCMVVPHEVVKHYGKDFGRHPVGTGPFTFQYWKEGVKLVMLKNDFYFEKDQKGTPLPYLDGIVVTFIAEKHTAFMEFMQGNFDMISGIDPNYKDVLLDAAGNLKPEHAENIQMTRIPYLNTEYLGIRLDANAKLSPLQQIQIRQAINYGFDRRRMIRFLRNNLGYPGVYGIIPPGLGGFSENMEPAYEYDPQKTAKLLSEAGFPNGKGLPVITLQTTATYQDLCEYMQHQLAESGIVVQLDVVPPATLREMVSQSKSDFFRASWIADYPDAENYLSLFYSNNVVPNGPNYTHYSNPEFDKLYEQAVATSNDSIRNELYRNMNQIIMLDAPVVVLYYDVAIRFISKRIVGMKPNAMNLLNLKSVVKE